MPRSVLPPSLMLLFLVASPMCFGQNPTWPQMEKELRQAKGAVIDAVEEIAAANPSEDDLRNLRSMYNKTKEAYSAWADEAADAVRHGQKIDLNSETAKKSRSRLNDLGNYHDRFLKVPKDSLPFKFGQQKSTAQTVVQIGNLGTMVDKDIADKVKEHEDSIKSQREEFAKAILAGADWPDFNSFIKK